MSAEAPGRVGWAKFPRELYILLLGTFINRAGAFVVPFMALYITRERGLSVEVAGVVVSAFGAGGFFAALVGGVLADRMGRRSTQLLSLFGGAACLLVFARIQQAWLLGAWAAILGFVGEMHKPAVSAMIADLSPPHLRQEAFGWQYWAHNLGFAVASASAGLLAVHGYAWLFWGDAATMAIYGIVIALLVRETLPAAKTATPREVHRELGRVVGDRVFMNLVFFNLLIALIVWQNTVGLATDLKQRGFDESTFGWLLSLNGIGIAVFQPLIARSSIGLQKRAVTGALLFGLGHGGYAWCTTRVHFALCLAVWTAGEILLFPSISAIVADLSAPDLRGQYQGVLGLSWGTGSMLGPWLGAHVIAHFGYERLWLSCLSAGLVVAAGLMLTARARSERLAAVNREHPR